MAVSNYVNFAAFSRVPFVTPDGTLSREAQQIMDALQRRTGEAAGILYADDIVSIPSGSLSATDVQSALYELRNEKQPLDATLTAIAGVTTAADRVIYFTGVDSAAAATITSFARTLLDDASANAARTTLEIGYIDKDALGYATGNGGTVTQIGTKASSVNLNKLSGEITLAGSALAADTIVSFSLNNTLIENDDVLILNHVSGGTIGAYTLNASCGSGTATIYVTNVSTGSLSENPVLRFVVIRGRTS
jgi:hypothetical protein